MMRSVSVWSSLRVVMSSKMAGWTPLIPAIGYLIIFSDKLKDIFRLWFDKTESFEWRLYLVFF